MALIGKIRKNSWILVIMVGLGLGGFIIMDVSSAGGMGGNTTFSVGEVNGTEIDWIEFQKAEEALYQNSGVDVYNRREYLWDYFVEQVLVDDEADALGLNVGEDEMQELQYGVNISPVVTRNFTDPNTGQLNRQSLNEFRTLSQSGELPPQALRIWEFQEKEIAKDRKQAKLLNIVKKGIYTPTWMAEQIQAEVGSSIDFQYVMIPYDVIDDSEVEVTDADYNNYIKAHSEEYTLQEETRDAKYLVVDVLPTPEDSMLLREKISALMVEFEQTDEDSIFATNQLGGYDAAYLRADVIPDVIEDTVFNMEAGTVYGPYIDQGSYWAVKVLGTKVVPDSVSSRHILLAANTQEDVPRALAMADSLETMLRNDISLFDTLATQYSDDPGSRLQGGDLGYYALNGLVKPMNDLLFYSDAERGEVHRVITQFGIHLVEVMDRKFETNEEGVRLASIREPIIPSELTQDAMYDDMLEFAGQNRTIDALAASADEDIDMTLEDAFNLRKNDFVVGELEGGSSSRDIVRWLFNGETKTNTVAPNVFIFEDPVNYFNAKYVLAGLVSINKAGLASPEQVMEVIDPEVKNEKKAEVILSQITEGSSLQSVAEAFDVEIDSVENINFGVQFMRNIGEEPLVLGTSTSMEVDDISNPIVGTNGVYVIQITKHVPASLAQNIPRLRRQGSFQVQNAADFELLDAMRKDAKVKDLRSRYY